MQILSATIRKVLLTLGYPRLDRDLVGPYSVGATTVRIPVFTTTTTTASSSSSSTDGGGGTACQIFYPCQTSIDNEDKGRQRKQRLGNDSDVRPYFRPEAVRGLIDYLQMGDGILQYLSESPHPCHVDAEPVTNTYTNTNTNTVPDTTPSSSPTKISFPLIVFSHGLAGTMELYTELCSQLASLGCCVVALEHEDGSAAFAETVSSSLSSSSSSSSTTTTTTTTTTIPYKRPNNDPYSRNKVLAFRTSMLQHRVREVHTVTEYLIRMKMMGTTSSRHSLLNRVLDTIDPTQIHLMGHSFGGATQIVAAQQWKDIMSEMVQSSLSSSSSSTATNSPEIVVVPLPKSLTLLDPWAFSLLDEVLDRGMPLLDKEKNMEDSAKPTLPFPILSIISQSWTMNPETAQIVQFLRNCTTQQQHPDQNHRQGDGCGSGCHNNRNTMNNVVFSYYAKNSVHQSFSDSEAWFPTWIATRVYNRGKVEQRHETIRAVVQAWSRHCFVTDTTTTNNNNNSTIHDDDYETTSILRPFSIS